MAQPGKRRIRRILWPLLVTLTAFLIYLLTLAPTVLWGDDAYFQRTAYSATLRPDGGGHWLWLQLARLFVHLPWGDVAFRSNLLSAVAATATLIMLYTAARQAGLRRTGATVAVTVLGISHTFWMHAVRAEVYSLFTFFMAIHLWLWARCCAKMSETSSGTPGLAPFYAGAALFGITLLAHQMALLLMPAWAYLLWSQRRTLHTVHLVRLALAFFLGLVPFVIALFVQIVSVTTASFLEAVWLYFTHAGADFGPSLFDFSITMLPRDLVIWALFTVLQFIGPALGLIIWGMNARLRTQEAQPFWQTLAVLYVIDVLFAISYRVNDRYVFLLPGYMALALFAGAGWEALALRVSSAQPVWIDISSSFARRNALAITLFLLLAVPTSAYALAPRLLNALNLNPLDVRTLPGREPNEFFLWPGKEGYFGARLYGEQALRALPSEAILIGDHTPIETLRYLQQVEGVRRDVRLIQIGPGEDLRLMIGKLPNAAPIFLADDDPGYYNLDSLPQVSLVAHGPVFRLQLAGD